MKYRAPTVIMLATLSFGLVVMASSFPPAIAGVTPTTPQEVNLLSEANQIKFLIGAVGLLFFGYMWWIQRYINHNDSKHTAQTKRSDKIEAAGQVNATNLVELLTEHRMTAQLNQCGFGSTALKDAVEEALKPFEVYLHSRQGDPEGLAVVTQRKDNTEDTHEA